MAINSGAIFPRPQMPKVDIGLLNNSSSPEGNEELKKLRLALSICGYFQAVNHGIEVSFLDDLYDVGKRFFSLPREEKQRYLQPSDDLDAFRNDRILTGNQALDWNDSLYLNLYPDDDQRRLKLWPENPKDFRKILLGYMGKLQKLNEVILKAMAKSLSLEENCFLKQCGESPNMLSTFNSYPPCSSPELSIGAKPHSDASALTFFLQDEEVGGLEVMIDNNLFRMPINHHAMLVIVGDQAEIMTNGIFKSRIHRFVTNPERERITISTFFTPDKRNVIEPAEGLIDEKRPKLYKQVVDYPGAFFHEHNKKERLIDALKI